jgi:hypothetical protein
MKQLFLPLLAIMALTLSTASCSKEDEPEVVIDYAESIIGKWWHYATYDYKYDNTYDCSEQRIHATFTREGVCEEHEDGKRVYKGTYEIEGSRLTYIDPNGTSSTPLRYKIEKITPDYMEIDYTYTYMYGDSTQTKHNLYKYKRLL